MTISLSQVVQVNPSVLAAAGNAIDINAVLLSQDTSIPNQQLLSFSNAADVGTYFGLSSDEYQLALVYFQGPTKKTRTPGQLYFYRYNEAAVPAWLRGWNLSTMTLDQLKLVSGTLTVSTNGTPNTSASINLSAATSFSNAASIIQAAFTSPTFTVTYDSQRAAFLITTTGTGSVQVVDSVSGAVANSLFGSPGIYVTSPGGDASIPANVMQNVAQLNANWATFGTVWQASKTELIGFSTWAATQNDRYAFFGADNDPLATSGSDTTWVATIKAANMDGTIPYYGNPVHAVCGMSWAASINFTRRRGRSTLAFQSFSGVTPSVTDSSVASLLQANGYNFIGSYGAGAAQFQWTYNGSVTGQFKWADTYINQIWLSAQLQLALATLLSNAGSIPYNAEGRAMIDTTIQDPAGRGVNFGAIRTGIALSDQQKGELEAAIGSDISQTLFAQGYYVQILDADAATRSDRLSPPMTFWYCDGGSVQELALASIAIQ